MATLLYRLGRACVRYRFVVALVWLAVLVLSGVGAATLSGETVNDFRIPGQESTSALDVMADRFGAGSAGASAQVVIQAPGDGKIIEPATAGRVAGLVAQLSKLPGVASASNPLDPKAPAISPDMRAAYSTVTYTVRPTDLTDDQRRALLDAVDTARAGGLTVEVGGTAMHAVPDLGGPTEGIGVVVALIVLALTYGSLVAAGMNLLTAIVGVGTGALGITALTGFVDLQSTTPVLALMLGLAVGIDYALFIVTRYRQELLDGHRPAEAAARATGTAGSAVVTAGITVVIALAGLAVAGIPFLTEMGLTAAATIVIAVAVAVTLVPAILGLFGRRLLPRRVRAALAEIAEIAETAETAETAAGAAGAGASSNAAGAGHGFYRGWVGIVSRQRWASLLVAVAALAGVAVPVLSMQTSLAQDPPPGTTQARATQLLAERFGPGVTGPLLILLDGPGAGARAAAVREQATAVPGVAFVAAPRVTPDGGAALITVIPKSGPEEKATEDVVHALRDRVRSDARAHRYITGQTAINIDVSRKLDAALPVYLLLVVGLALILLVLVFRSILVPVTAALGFLLTIGASLGATTAVFQWGWMADVVNADSTGPLLSLAPIIIIGVLFGLAMDYQVFLVSRIHEAHAHGAGPREAILTGFRHAAPVVVAAATIMFGVFAGFVPEGEAAIKPIAFALAMGIAFDAFVVRMVIMPASLALLGRAAWWLPRWLRWLPALDVEGTALRPAPPAVPRPTGAAPEPVTAGSRGD